MDAIRITRATRMLRAFALPLPRKRCWRRAGAAGLTGEHTACRRDDSEWAGKTALVPAPPPVLTLLPVCLRLPRCFTARYLLRQLLPLFPRQNTHTVGTSNTHPLASWFPHCTAPHTYLVLYYGGGLAPLPRGHWPRDYPLRHTCADRRGRLVSVADKTLLFIVLHYRATAWLISHHCSGAHYHTPRHKSRTRHTHTHFTPVITCMTLLHSTLNTVSHLFTRIFCAFVVFARPRLHLRTLPARVYTRVRCATRCCGSTLLRHTCLTLPHITAPAWHHNQCTDA